MPKEISRLVAASDRRKLKHDNTFKRPLYEKRRFENAEGRQFGFERTGLANHGTIRTVASLVNQPRSVLDGDPHLVDGGVRQSGR
jgi:hypothetical protein